MEQKDEKRIKYKKLKDNQIEFLVEWWNDLHERNGPRAALKRCASPEDASLYPDTFRVKNIISWMSYEAAATIAGILSHVVRESNVNINMSFAKTLSYNPEGSKPVFSETRFRQLLSSRNWNEFYTRLRRAVKALKGKVNPVSVADIIVRWDEEYRWGKNKSEYGHSLKFDLSEEYYSSAETN
jgi:CRISPR system Cascade subunit CasB